jgi:hypothetical protein
MRPRPAGTALALMMALVPVGCRKTGQTESRVDVPVRLEDVRKLHAPPAVTVTVERQHDKPTASCGHSPVCAIVLAAVAWKRMFPDKWDEARVVEDGRVVYEGRFDTSGAFIEALVRRDGQARMIGVLPLEKLGRRYIVELARAPLRSDGSPGEFQATPLLPQVDLPAAYRARFAEGGSERARAGLLVELGRTLREEALPTLAEILPKESDEVAARTVEGLCEEIDDNSAATAVCRGVLDKLVAAHGPRTALVALPATKYAPALAPPFALTVVAHGCAVRSEARVLAQTFESMKVTDAVRSLGASPEGVVSGSPEVRAAIDKCGAPERRCLFRQVLGHRPSEEELRAALAHDQYRQDAVGHLDLNDPTNRRLLKEAVSAEEYQRTLDERVLLRFGAGNRAIPTAEELEGLARIYRDSLPDDNRPHTTIVYLFHRANVKGDHFGVAEPDASVAPARAILEQAIAAKPTGYSAYLSAGLLALGDRGQAQVAAKGFDVPKKDGLGRRYAIRETKVVAEALLLAGCTDEEIEQVRAQAPSLQAGTRGELCTKAVGVTRSRSRPALPPAGPGRTSR